MSKFFGRHTILNGDRSPYMTRYWFGRLRLHIFYRGDSDPDPHDHPWGFWTFPLTSYVEEVTTAIYARPWSTEIVAARARRQLVRAFRLHYRSAQHCHRALGRASRDAYTGTSDENGEFILVPAVAPGRIFTFVWRGEETREWGFLKYRGGRWCWQRWKKYVFEGGRNAPCGDDR